ncbi:MAG: TatD family hydrolase [Candidatus Omnitrophica bacterium]|nr:TatD family hydrolase [Candidatus Omnitrophota bacterium]
MINLIDTHAHLDGIEDIDSALNRAKEAGVTTIIAQGVDLASNKKNLAIKQKFLDLDIRLAFGIHPGNIIDDEIEETFKFIRDHKSDIVAIGETGLDFWYRWVRKSDEKKQQQKQILERQIDLAKEFDLPIVIHSRGAWADCFSMAEKNDVEKAVFHWYSGPEDVLKSILNKGYFISATPALAYSPELRVAVKLAPIDQILIETDSPVFYRIGEGGFQAEPKDVFRTLEFLSEIKNIDLEKAANLLNQNAKKVFGE